MSSALGQNIPEAPAHNVEELAAVSGPPQLSIHFSCEVGTLTRDIETNVLAIVLSEPTKHDPEVLQLNRQLEQGMLTLKKGFFRKRDVIRDLPEDNLLKCVRLIRKALKQATNGEMTLERLSEKQE